MTSFFCCAIISLAAVVMLCQVRPAIQNCYVAAMRGQMKLGSLPGSGASEILAHMTGELAQGDSAGHAGHAGAVDFKAILQDKEALRQCKQFLLANNSVDVRKHPAFIAWMSKIRSVVCQCPATADEWDPASSCDFHDCTHTLQDICWGLANVLDQEAVVPNAAPAIGAGCLMLALSLNDKAQTAVMSGDGSQSQADATSDSKDSKNPKDTVHLE